MSHMYNVLLPAPFPNLLFQPIKVFAMAARAIPIQFYNSSDPLSSAEFQLTDCSTRKKTSMVKAGLSALFKECS